mmetsp:Transcript_3547/g.5986  ORF Transcript_3547/g.5986 Transcript_3547/m.5986 type:complete len:218 (+) Transcript_3547:908-1561(+)
MAEPRIQHCASSSPAVMTTAPQPSPNKMHVERSLQSTKRDKASPPTTRMRLADPALMYCVAVMRPSTKPLHAAVRSNAQAFFAPIPAWSWPAAPNRSSGDEVANRIRSIWSACTPAISRAALLAFTASSPRVSPLARTRLFLMPVREAIHSSFVSTNLAKSSLDTISLGSAEPTPVILQGVRLRDAIWAAHRTTLLMDALGRPTRPTTAAWLMACCS